MCDRFSIGPLRTKTFLSSFRELPINAHIRSAPRRQLATRDPNLDDC